MREGCRSGSLARTALIVAILSLPLCAWAQAADIYDRAVSAPKRSAEDQRRDQTESPAALLRLVGIAPGMTVVDLLAGAGYYSELLSRIVGPNGRVILVNNAAYEQWSPGLETRLSANKFANVEHRTAELSQLNLAPASVDAILLVKVFHDLYWVDPDGIWPRVDADKVLDQLVIALKPGGTLLLVDHSAKEETGTTDTYLHRIDEAFVIRRVTAHRLELKSRSELLRNASDPRNQGSSDSSILGKTDRFVLLFQKKP